MELSQRFIFSVSHYRYSRRFTDTPVARAREAILADEESINDQAIFNRSDTRDWPG
jgi:hypothetical protein